MGGGGGGGDGKGEKEKRDLGRKEIHRSFIKQHINRAFQSDNIKLFCSLIHALLGFL